METNGDLIAAIERHSQLLEAQIRQQRDWRLPLRNGVLAGLGGVIGASLIVTLVVWVVQPFKGIEPLKPTLDRLTRALENDQRR